MGHEETLAMCGLERMRVIDFICGNQPACGEPYWAGVALAALVLLGMLALSVRAVCRAAAEVRGCIRRDGFAMTLLMCLAVCPLLYVGGTKRGAGGAGAGGSPGQSGEGSARDGGNDPRGGSAPGGEPLPGVVFQSTLPGPAHYPAAFTNNPDTLVQTVMLAAVGDAADLATLVDAPETARIRIAAEGCAAPRMTPLEQSLTTQFVPAQWFVAEIDFECPVPLGSLAFGDTAGRPLWMRGWQGEIAEAVCFGVPPCGDVRAGVANYLAVRWGFHGYRATHAQRQAAIGAGLNYGLVWGTVIIVR